ncbi:MAG: hypothetical protein ABEH86_07245 [Haloarcula sp.]
MDSTTGPPNTSRDLRLLTPWTAAAETAVQPFEPSLEEARVVVGFRGLHKLETLADSTHSSTT